MLETDVFQHSHYIDRDSTYLSNYSLQTYAITDTVQKIAESYECKPIEGMLSHQLEQNIIDGESEDEHRNQMPREVSHRNQISSTNSNFYKLSGQDQLMQSNKDRPKSSKGGIR